MKRLLLLCLTLAASLANADDRWDKDRDRDRDRDRYDDRRDGWRKDAVVMNRRELLRELNDVERLLQMLEDRERDPRQRDRMRTTRNELRDLQDAVNSAPRVGDRPDRRYRDSRFVIVTPEWPSPPLTQAPEPEPYNPYVKPPPGNPNPLPPPPPNGRPMPMADAAFRQLVQAIASESFPQNQLGVLSQAAPVNYFVVAQVREIIQRFNFSRDKLSAVATLKPRILDMENAYQLSQDFTFNNDKEQLRQILGSR